MDLLLEDKTAIVCGAWTDLGAACAEALAGEGVRLFLPAEGRDALNPLLDRLGTAAAVRTVHCNPCAEDGRARLMEACPEPDILVNHGPGPPMGDFRDWTRDDWLRALDQNMLMAVELIRSTLDGMIERGFGRILNITSQSVKSPMARLDLSNAARAGLTGFVAGVSRYPRRADVTINNLLPGMFETEPLRHHIRERADSEHSSIEEITAELLGPHPLGRLGRPREFGALCAFMASPLAGYVNGQNLLVDGGAFRGVL